MKVYSFDMTEYCNDPGNEMVLYTSNDVNGSWCSERGCFIAALKDHGVDYDFEEWEMFDIMFLEDIALRKGLYIKFVDDCSE